jgi:chorismate lyase/3-hydroxybenzoate synthase
LPAYPRYLNPAEICARTVADGASILGVIGYGDARPPAYADTGPFLAVTMDGLADSPCCEAWVGPDPVEWQEADGIVFAISGDTLFGAFDPNFPAGQSMEAVAYDIYARLFALADRTGYRHVVRVFNYLSGITDDDGGEERYRRFNTGRHNAFQAFGRALEAAPAACAVGMRTGAPAVAFLACSEPGQPIENPRQVSAYRYPPDYGPRSPSFSRAMLAGNPGARVLHISGTASIVGHESLHPGDVTAQTHEALRNIAALLAQCGGLTFAAVRQSLHLKTYIKRRRDVAAIRDVMTPLAPASQIMFVEGEICRPSLLVEIEAFCQVPTL